MGNVIKISERENEDILHWLERCADQFDQQKIDAPNGYRAAANEIRRLRQLVST